MTRDGRFPDETPIRYLALPTGVNRDTAFTLAVALLAIVAFGTAAATLDTAVDLGGGDGGSGFGSGTADDGAASGPGAGPLIPSDFSGEIGPICYPVLQEPFVIAAIGLVFVGIFTYIYRDSRDYFSAFVVCGVVAIPVGIVWTLLAFCGDPLDSSSSDSEELGLPVSSDAGNETRFPLLGGGGAGEASGTAISSPTVVVFVLIGIALLGAVAVVLASRGDDDRRNLPEPPRPADTAADVRAVAHAAGRAADRIATDVAVDNEVFRAWAAMTDALDLESPETTTPAAFEQAAVDAGMEPEDVAELRRLFEEVRYGEQKPSEDRERRAMAALRRVEREYGDLGSNTGER